MVSLIWMPWPHPTWPIAVNLHHSHRWRRSRWDLSGNLNENWVFCIWVIHNSLKWLEDWKRHGEKMWKKHIQNLECFPKHFRQFFKAVAFKSPQAASKPKSRRCVLYFAALFLQKFVTIVTFRPAARDMFNKIKPCWNRNFVWRVSIRNTFKHQVMLSTHDNACHILTLIEDAHIQVHNISLLNRSTVRDAMTDHLRVSAAPKRHCRARGNRGAVAKSQAPRWPRCTPSWGSGNSSSQKRDGPEKNMGPMAIQTSESQHNDTYKGGIYYANWCQLMPTICTWASISWLFLVVSQNKLYLSGWFFHFFEPIWWHYQTYL